MSTQKVSGTFKLEYKNSNNRHEFIDAHYRIVDKRGNVLRTGKTNQDGMTDSATVKKGEPIYIELKDLSTDTWESASPRKKIGYTPTRSGQSATIWVTNCYFQAKLMSSKWVNFKIPWKYEVVFEGKNISRTLSGTLDSEGKTKIYDSQKMPVSVKNKSTALASFQDMILSDQPNVKVVFIEPITGERFPDSKRVIPIGADKKYREFQIEMSSNVTASITSQLKLQKKKNSRTIILDIDITAGATYTITREDNEEFFNNKLEETKKSDFKDGTPHTIYIPKKYNGKILLKKGSKIIAKFPLEALDPNKKNAPIVFCLGNKSTTVPKQKISINDIDKTDPMMWHCQTNETLSEGEGLYEFDRESKGSADDLIKIANTLFGSTTFDGIVLPIVGEAHNASRANNRAFIYDAFKKLKVGKDKQDILKFYIKKSKTGANMIIFKGYSGLRSFLTGTRYGVDNVKVGMIASASSVYAAATSAGIGAAAKTTASSAGRSLGGIGFGIVATFEIAEWLTSDDPFNNWSDLWMGLGSSAIKAVIATAVGLAVGGMAIAFTAAAAPAIFIIGIGALAVIGVSFGLEALDSKFQITNRAKGYVNELGY